MKTVYIPAKAEVEIAPVLDKVDFKGKLGVVTTVQHLEELNKIKKDNFEILGQVLGCNVKNALNLDVDAYVFVGSGKFHAIQIARKTGKRVFLANPFTSVVTELDLNEVEKIEKRVKGAYAKYLMSKKIGVLVSVKKLQHYMQGRDFDFVDKDVYYFLCDDVSGLENFPDIEVWVNTACPRLAYEGEFGVTVLNLEDLKGFVE
tara:strand:- start:362 stop:970 length:609 start_codon:yes stop_codon:yes gene_type:complete